MQPTLVLSATYPGILYLNGHFAGELCAELLAEHQSAHADHESHRRYGKCRHHCVNCVVFRDGKSHGKRVDRGCHALYHQCTEAYAASAVLVTFFASAESFDQHFSADESEKSESDPRNELFKRLEIFEKSMYGKPAEKRHESLKECEHACDHGHTPSAHTRFMKTVCQRHGKSVHCQTDAEHCARDEKSNTPVHIHLKNPKKIGYTKIPETNHFYYYTTTFLHRQDV